MFFIKCFLPQSKNDILKSHFFIEILGSNVDKIVLTINIELSNFVKQ